MLLKIPLTTEKKNSQEKHSILFSLIFIANKPDFYCSEEKKDLQ